MLLALTVLGGCTTRESRESLHTQSDSARSEIAAREGAVVDTLDTARHAFVLRTREGDTIAVEQVQRGPGWLDTRIWLPRRSERHRVFVQWAKRDTSQQSDTSLAYATLPARPSRWDVRITRGVASLGEQSTAQSEDSWRVIAASDSLYVLSGAMIGEPVALQAMAAPRGFVAWHDASGALIESVVRAWSRDSRTAPATTQALHTTAITWPRTAPPHSVRVLARGPDSVTVFGPGVEWHLRVSDVGDVLGGHTADGRLLLTRAVWREDELPSTHEITAHPADGGLACKSREARLRASDGITLVGTLTQPASSSSGAVVLLVSGAGPQDRNLSVPGLPGYRLFSVLADSLCARGMAVLRWDDRGVGASGGIAYSATLADEVRDVEAAIAWLKTHEGVAAHRIGIVGHSDGGLTAVQAAESETVRAVVLLGAPALSGRELAREQRRVFVDGSANKHTPAQQSQLLTQLEREAERVAAIDAWLHAWLAHDPATMNWRGRAPALLVHGLRDQQVPPHHATLLTTILIGETGRAVQLHLVPNANHLLLADSSGDPRNYRELASFEPLPAVVAHIVSWLHARLHEQRNVR